MSGPRELPLLMSVPLVRATLDGLKTQTRRVVTDGTSQGNYRASEMKLSEAWADPGPSPAGNPGWYLHAPPDFIAALPRLARHGWTEADARAAETDGIVERLYPRWFPGDLLYVREAWRPWSWHEGEPIVLEYKAGGPRHEASGGPEAEGWEERMWEALTAELDAKGVPTDEHGVYQWEGESPLRWRPSIHLPKCGSRLWLRVLEVRVQRVQDISEDDAIAEGVGHGFVMNGGWPDYQHIQRNGHCSLTQDTAAQSFETLWDSINAARGYGWDTNPWVWAISYELAERP